MNIYPNLRNFMNEYSPPEAYSNNLPLSLDYQKNIRSKILKEILGFLQLFTHSIRETKNKRKLKLDFPFEAIPSAIMIFNNIIPNIRASIFVKIFIHDIPPDVIKLFESTIIRINFREIPFESISESFMNSSPLCSKSSMC
jgi:hypothetical protein